MRLFVFFSLLFITSSLPAEKQSNLAVPAGEVLEYPRLAINDAMQLYELWTGKKVWANASFRDKQVFFYQRGPLTNAEAGNLLEVTLQMNGLAIHPDPELKGKFILKEDPQPPFRPKWHKKRNHWHEKLSNPEQLIITDGQVLELPRMEGLLIMDLMYQVSGQRLIFDPRTKDFEIFFYQAGPMTHQECAKALTNSLSLAGIAIVPAENHPSIFVLVPTHEERFTKVQKRTRKRQAQTPPRIRYVPRPKKQ